MDGVSLLGSQLCLVTRHVPCLSSSFVPIIFQHFATARTIRTAQILCCPTRLGGLRYPSIRAVNTYQASTTPTEF